MEKEKIEAYMERRGMSEEGKRGYLEMLKTRMDERVSTLQKKLEKAKAELKEVEEMLRSRSGGEEK